MNKVDVIIPSFNRPKQLARALISLLGQTRSPNTIFVIFDEISFDAPDSFILNIERRNIKKRVKTILEHKIFSKENQEIFSKSLKVELSLWIHQYGLNPYFEFNRDNAQNFIQISFTRAQDFPKYANLSQMLLAKSYNILNVKGRKKFKTAFNRNDSSTRGPSFCRNLGVSFSNANWVAFLDDDDAWHPQKLEFQLDFFEKNPSFQWLHTNEEWFFLKSSKPSKKSPELEFKIPVKQKSIHRKEGGTFLERSFNRCLISPSAVIFDRLFFLELNGFMHSFCVAEDFEFWLRAMFSKPVGFIDKKLTFKYAGEWNQLSTTLEIDRYRVLALHRFLRFYRNQAKANSEIIESLKKSFLKKVNILIKGAKKYQHLTKLKRYESWLTLATNRRTWSIRILDRG